MAKKKSSKLKAGTPVRIKPGTPLPEFPNISIDDWAGMVLETKGSGANLQYIIEWDDATVEKMPQSYLEQCEEQGLFFRMACLPAAQVVDAAADNPDT